MAGRKLVWSQLHLPRPLDEHGVLRLLSALASDRRASDLVFELHAGPTGVSHLLGCDATSVQKLKRVIGDHLPGTIFDTAPDRTPMAEVGTMVLKPRGLLLRTDNAADVSLAILSAAGLRLRAGEAMAVQIVLGKRRPPTTLGDSAPTPNTSLWRTLTRGTEDASTDEVRQMRQRAEDAGFDAFVRVGAIGSDPARTRRLIVGLQSALMTAKGPGVRMEFHHADPRSLDQARLPRRFALELGTTELLGVLGWPLGDDDLPGMPSLHPRPLRPAAALTRTERVFAVPATPGDNRPVGISAADSLMHMVTYGPTRSGKSTALIHLIKADMYADRPVVVLDPKRQLVDEVLTLVPPHRHDDVVVLDLADDHPVGFNPLDVTGRDPDIIVDGIMSVFAGLFSDGFGPRTLDIFSGALRSLARASSISGIPATLADVPRILTNPAFRRSVVGQIQHDETLTGFWSWYESQSPGAQAAAIAAPLSRLRQLLLRPALLRMLDQRQTRFSLRNVWRDNLIVLVPANEALIGTGTASMLGSLVLADLWLAIQERAAERDPERRPGTVYVDEAPRFMHLPTSLGDALAISRSLGCAWHLAAQYSGQFPNDVRAAVDMNARSKLVFRTEYEDAKHFAKGSRDLTPEDFMSLGKFQAYANLVADGHPQGWALVQTLPPCGASSDPDRVRAHSRARWSTAPDEPATAQTGPDVADSGPTAPPALTLQVGRKRRDA
jgi:hypothetical protein